MARTSSRKLWAAHVENQATGKVRPGSSSPATTATQSPDFQRGKPFSGLVLGVDPSLRGTGICVLEVAAHAPAQHKYSRTIKIGRSASFQECLLAIAESILGALDQFPVTHAAVEQSIYVQNFQTAQILGAARGAALTALALRRIPTFEYAPLRIKQAITGHGRASKEQMIRAIQQMLKLDVALPSDEADAAGVALCHAFTHRD